MAAMKTCSWGRWLGVAAGLWAATAIAQEAPEPVLLTVLGTNYTARDLGVGSDSPPDLLTTRTFLKIQGGIMGDFIAKLNYQPGEDELKEYCRRSAPTTEEMKATFGGSMSLSTEKIFEGIWQEWQRDATNEFGSKQIAANALKEWKVARALFDRYGGRVYVDDYRVPGVPDAGRAYLAEREAAGDFTIHDARLREQFWELLRTPSPMPLVSEEEGRAALAEHPADRQKRQTMEGMKNHLRPEQPAASAPETP